MANAYPLDNVKESIIRELSGTKSWLMQIENKADVKMYDSDVEIGDANYTVLDNATANTVTNKTGTAVVADKGVRHTVAATTVYDYQPVKYFPAEMDKMLRNGVMEREVTKDALKQVDAVMKQAAAALVDALSDGALVKTGTLADGNTDFAAATEAAQIANMTIFGGVFGQVAAYNDGGLPDWIIANTTAYGNLTGYSQNARGAIQAPTGFPTVFGLRGVPFWAQSNGTTGKWAAASKACLLMGANRHLLFKIRNVFAENSIVFQESTGLWVLPVGITYTYGADFTGTTGLALGIGEVINGVS